MTPAIELCRQLAITITIHRYEHQAQYESYGLEAAEKLKVPPEQVFKTLIVSDGKSLYAALVPVTEWLNLKKPAKAVGVKKLEMAEPHLVEKKTGYVLGGVSPLAQKHLLPTWIDQSALEFSTMYVSAGKRGLEIEITPDDLGRLVQAKFTQLT